MTIQCDLAARHCSACEGGVLPLDATTAQAMLATLYAWQLAENRLEKTFSFRNHYEAMAFANAVAWISHGENHHPELTIGYRDVRVRYWTHAVDALTENDFICAAKIEKLAAFSG